jgi:hypothetical protein
VVRVANMASLSDRMQVTKPPRALTLVPMLASVVSACGGQPALKPGDAAKPEVPARLLLDVVSDTEARAVAIIEHGHWSQPYSEPETVAKQIAQSRASYTLLPSAAAQTATTFEGALKGSIRDDCGELYAALSAVPPAFGFAVAGAATPIRSVVLSSVPAGPGELAAVSRLVKAQSGVELAPTIEAVYSVDLDGNGLSEVIVQATHPDLHTDFADYKPEYYSLVVVMPDHAGAEPVYAGYVQGANAKGGFEVFALDALADVDSDGTLELLVRGRHNEGSQSLVYRYDGSMKEVFRTVGGEGACQGEGE